MDALSELAPNYTPYRYGFNNPVFWQDATGLFETYGQAMKFLEDNNLNGKISFLDDDDPSQGFTVTVIGGEFDGQVFYAFYSELKSLNGDGGGSDGNGGGNGNPKGAKNNSPASESPNFLDGANWLVGTTGTALEYTPGSFRLTNGAYNGDVFSPKFYASGWTGGSVARIKTYNLAKIGKGLGQATFGAGLLIDGYGLYEYIKDPTSSSAVHPAKFGLNTGMSVYGIYVNPITGALYGGLEAFYPGGTLGAMNDYSNAQSAYRQTNNGSIVKSML